MTQPNLVRVDVVRSFHAAVALVSLCVVSAISLVLLGSRVSELWSVVPFDMAKDLWRAPHEPKQHLWLDRVGHNQTFYAARHEALTAIRGFLASLHVTGREPRGSGDPHALGDRLREPDRF